MNSLGETIDGSLHEKSVSSVCSEVYALWDTLEISIERYHELLIKMF